MDVTLAAALAATTTLLAIAFACSTAERWLDRRRGHHAAWTIALASFAAASGVQWLGAAIGWDAWSFRVFYLLGPVVSVPYLALGTVLLLGGAASRRRWWTTAHVFAAFATGVLVTAPTRADVSGTGLPQGSDVFGVPPRVLAAVGSGLPSLVIIGGAVWSAWRLRREGTQRRLVVSNALVALGTVVLGAAGLLNSVLDEMSAFAAGHAIGLSLVFAGFLVTAPPRRVLRLADAPARGRVAG